MKITFLGTGTSVGTPVIACNCDVCKSNDKKNFRYRASIFIEVENKKIVIDCGPDFRIQMLKNNITDIDAVFFTHAHRDHTAGLDDLRPFNFMLHKTIDIIANKITTSQIIESFPYIFKYNHYKDIPKLNLIEIDNNPFVYQGLNITPIEVKHDKDIVFGYRFGDFSYITDANFISENELLKLKGTKTLVINSLGIYKHHSHFSLEESLEIVKLLKPQKAYLTHISHMMGLHSETQRKLPKNVFLAFDGLKIEI